MDRWASELNDVDDVERLLPGTISAVREWFRTYKIPDGKPPNVFGLEERCMPRAYAMGIVHETHRAWEKLLTSADESDVALSGVDDDTPKPGLSEGAFVPEALRTWR